MRSYFDGMLRYFEISGRSTRMQYWMFFLIQLVLTILAIVVDILLGGFASPQQPMIPATLFVAFIHIVPAITVSIRRLHDIGRSGFWYLLYLVPFAGIVLLYWSCCASDPDRNAYDAPEPSRYEPRGGYRPIPLGASTIPRQIRMGANAVRPPSLDLGDSSAPQRFI